MSNDRKLKVIIVGSGLCGLTAARILREYHHVTVYERGDAAVATGGQGVMVAPNGVKILESIGYERARAGAVPIYGGRFYDKKGNVLQDFEMDLKTRFGAECLSQKRSDLRDELMRLATTPSAELGIEGDPARILYNTAVVNLNAEYGVVRLSDGSTAEADVVIVADGIHSRLRTSIVGSDGHTAKKTGLTCYRVAVSTEDAKRALGNLTLPDWWDPSTSGNRVVQFQAADGSPRAVTAYPLRYQTYFNLSCIIRTQESRKSTTESWHADGDRATMVEHFDDFDEPLKRILSAATEVKVWELQDLEPLPTWTRGRAIVIGDAAHAMTPMQGQGANMSIEDAESLRLLAPGTRRDDVGNILKLVESVRRPRTARMLAETRKAHATVGESGDKMITDLEFQYGYNGIYDALKKGQGETGA